MRKLLARILEWLLEVTGMHSKWFNKVKMWYEKGLWTIDMVFAAVPRMISADEYKEITGEDYDWPEQ